MTAVLASQGEVPLTSARLVYEPKYDGIRVLAAVTPAHPTPTVSLYSRNGNDKAAQFPEIVKALRGLASALPGTTVLDGELVALDARGEPASFTRLQGRMHLTGARDIAAQVDRVPTAFIVFDLLRVGQDDLRPLALTLRRARLEKLLHTRTDERLREGSYVAGDGRALLERARAEDWEGLLVKDADSRYTSGRRSPAWRKLKLKKRAEFVIGGWTKPKGTRAAFGALAVGTPVDRPKATAAQRRGARDASASGDASPALRYCGNVGTGFNDRTLVDLATRLAPLARTTSPFVEGTVPRGVQYVEPRLVCEVEYAEFTPDGNLRHPVFLGLREDVAAAAIRDDAQAGRGRGGLRLVSSASAREASASARGATADTSEGVMAASASALRAPADTSERRPYLTHVEGRLRELEEAGRDGTLEFDDGTTLDVSNLRKVFWPPSGLTKGDLLRHYLRVAPFILPVVADRPLVMKRFPNGVKGKSFYQHRAPDPLPAGVRVALVEDDGDGEAVPQIIGGTLQTLLYGAQLASISQDPWFSRVGSLDQADMVAIDLDPMPGVPFRQVLDVARWLHEMIVLLELPAVAKTSGASGLHIFFPLAPGTSYQSGLLLCQILATAVATRHPQVATVERSVAKRGRTVYVDYLQNIRGKTLACAYSARASEFAGVSAPLRWEELDEDVRPEDVTLQTIAARLDKVGDLWNPVMTGPPVDLLAVLERLERG
jgi:bifunctional non-homologous end joining protein LigD